MEALVNVLAGHIFGSGYLQHLQLQNRMHKNWNVFYILQPIPHTSPSNHLNQPPLPSPSVSTFMSKIPHPNNEAASLFCNFNDMTDASSCCSTAASTVLSLERFLRFRRSTVLFRCQQGCFIFPRKDVPMVKNSWSMWKSGIMENILTSSSDTLILQHIQVWRMTMTSSRGDFTWFHQIVWQESWFFWVNKYQNNSKCTVPYAKWFYFCLAGYYQTVNHDYRPPPHIKPY